MKLFILAAVLGITLCDDATLDAVVNFAPDNTVDIAGTMKFTFDTSSTNSVVTGSVAIDVVMPGTVDYTMKIHEFLADFSKVDRCSVDYIGAAMTGNLATIVANAAGVRAANKGAITLSTTNPGIHVVGRSVALYSTTGNKDMVACFPIVAQAQSTYYRSKIMEKVGINGEITMIRSKLAAANSGYRLSTNMNLLEPGLADHLHSIQIGTEAITQQQSCNEVAGNNFYYIHQWGDASPGTTIKQYNSNTDTGAILGTAGTPPTALLVKRNFPVTNGRSNQQATCNPIYQIASKSATATFFQKGMQFSVKFTQESPFHPVKITATGLSSAVNTLTVKRLVVSNYACPRYESQYTSVSTACALLWSKDKTTVDIESLTTTNYATHQITMYGPSSILGKAFLFEIDNESYCADIKNDNSVARWIADFHGNLGGNVILEQDLSNRWDDTTVYNSLYSDTARSASLYLSSTPGNEAATLISRCPTVWSSWYAYSGNGDLNTNAVCAKQDYYYNCPRGTTNTRMGTLEVQKIAVGNVRFTQVLHDPYLPMSGTNTIPLNVHLTYQNGPTRTSLDCAKLKNVGDMAAEASIVADDSDTKKSFYSTAGSVKFAYDDNSNNMKWTASFTSILAHTTSLTLNEGRVATSKSGYPYLACSEGVLGQVLNFNNAKSMDLTGDSAPSGNLSAIDEMLKESSKLISQTKNTNQFDFFSPAYTPMYSSLRLGYGDKDEPYNCANMNPVLDAEIGQSEKWLYAAFYNQPSQGQVSGDIKFRQVSVVTSGGNYLYPTNVEINLGHWHHPRMLTDTHRIYITKYSSCSDFPNGSIRPKDDLYNPYSIISSEPVKSGEFPHMFSVGDVTAKSGKYVTLGKRMMFNVDNLPLTGPFSILGKAVVISDSIGDNFIGCTVITDARVNGGVTLTVSLITLFSTLLLSLL